MNIPTGAPVDQEKKVKIAKEKKEQADKAFQTSDLPTGTPAISFHFTFHVWHRSMHLLVGRIALRFYHEVNSSRQIVFCRVRG